MANEFYNDIIISGNKKQCKEFLHQYKKHLKNKKENEYVPQLFFPYPPKSKLSKEDWKFYYWGPYLYNDWFVSPNKLSVRSIKTFPAYFFEKLSIIYPKIKFKLVSVDFISNIAFEIHLKNGETLRYLKEIAYSPYG